MPHSDFTGFFLEEKRKKDEENAKRKSEARREEGYETEAKQETEGQEESLEGLTVPELKDKAKEAGIEGYSGMKKDELIEELRG